MSDTMQPALSPAEWETVRRGGDILHSDNQDRAISDARHVHASNIPSVIAFLNDRLPDDDPRKITRFLVEAVRDAARYAEGEHDDPSSPGFDSPVTFEAYTRLDAIADALESYLPPA